MATILGINAFHAGASACLVVDGVPVAAVAEERLNRKKYFGGFPELAICSCLEQAGATIDDIDVVAVGRNPRANRARKAAFAASHPRALRSFSAISRRGRQSAHPKNLLATAFDRDPATLQFRVENVEHHVAHIASSYFISPWERACGVSIDGSGDFVTVMIAECGGEHIRVRHRTFVPDSLGSFYFAVCQFIGYSSYGDEGKVMGLAPLGKDSFREEIDKMVSLSGPDVRLNFDYFREFGSDAGIAIEPDGTMSTSLLYSEKFEELFGPPRVPRSEITGRDEDLAFGVQRAFEDVYLDVLRNAHEMVPNDRLVLSGGCALNSVANGMIFDQTPFATTCIQPSAGDEGLAMGAALYVSNAVLREGNRWTMSGSYFGPEFTDLEIQAELDRYGVEFRKLDRPALLDATTSALVEGNVVGWFQGKMEWGPRALGNRSILAHPGYPGMKDILNSRVKHRESFRPFAPSVLVERQTEIFDQGHPSPYMLHVYKIRPEWRERLSAVNHVDNTGRLQSVARTENDLYYDLISQFEKKTGIPVILNTSFNENEPIVCTPSEAIECYLRTKMDVLAIGSFFCSKKPVS